MPKGESMTKESKKKSSDKARIDNNMKGGKVTDSGHTINLTNDQQTEFRQLYSNAVQDINTDSAFTAEQKRDLIKALPGMSDFGFYNFLKSQYRSGPDLAIWISEKRRAKQK